MQGQSDPSDYEKRTVAMLELCGLAGGSKYEEEKHRALVKTSSEEMEQMT
jgi:hypothetical protein